MEQKELLSPRARRNSIIVCCSIIGMAVFFAYLVGVPCHPQMFEKPDKHIKQTYAKLVVINYGNGHLASSVYITAITYINGKKIVFRETLDRSSFSYLYINEFYLIKYYEDFTCCSYLPPRDTCLDKQEILKLLKRDESDYLYNPDDALEKTGNVQYFIFWKWIKKKFLSL